MNVPDFVKSLAFWKALTFAVAGVLALLGYFDVIPDQYVYSADALLALVLTVLNFIGITPELRMRMLEARLTKAEKLLDEAIRVRNDLLGLKQSKKMSK